MTLIRAFAVAAVLLAPALSLAQAKKYDLKSGVVTFEKVQHVGTMKLVEKVVVRFDDFGARERRDTWKNGKLEETFLSDDVRHYHVNHRQKTAWDSGPANKGRGTELRFDWDEVSAEDKKAGRAVQIAPMKVAGKSCEAYEVKTPSGLLRVAGASKVLLYNELDSKAGKMSMHSATKAVSFEENAAIPADTFTVPSGYKIEKR